MNFEITAGFLLVTLIIGIMRRGRTPDILNYYVSGRSKSAFAVSASIVATAIGGSATIGLAGLACAKGAPAVWWLFSGSIALVVLGILWAGKVREYEVFTLPEILEKQYGGSLIKIISSCVIVTAWTGVIAAQMIAAGKIMDIVLPGHYRLLIILCALTFIIYTVLGGQNSIIRTDIFQAFLIFTGIVITLFAVRIKYGNPAEQLLPAGHLSFPVNNALGLKEIIMYFMFVGTSYLAGPDMYSRILSARDKKSAQKSVFIAAMVIVVFAMFIVMIGLYARMLSPGIDPESSFQFVIMNSTGPGIQGVIFAALLAAFLSTAATCLLTSGIIMTNDIINPIFFRDSLDERKKLLLTRSVIICYGIVSLIIALYVNGIIKSLFLALTVYTAGIVLPVVLGFYREKLKLNKWGAAAGILTGGVSSLYMKYMAMDEFMLYIFPAVLVIIMIISRITKE